MEWFDKNFESLTVDELFQILKLRATVFNTEQHSDYCDPDDHDPLARHVFATENGKIIAYARYFQVDDSVTFGRVVIDSQYRGQGLGKDLVKHILDGIKAHFPQQEIMIHAQSYVKSLYAQFGFTAVGKEFIEADRKHYKMIHPAIR